MVRMIALVVLAVTVGCGSVFLVSIVLTPPPVAPTTPQQRAASDWIGTPPPVTGYKKW